MMEEFRRRKNLKNYHEEISEMQHKVAKGLGDDKFKPYDHKDYQFKKYYGSNVERFFECGFDEVFDAN